MRSILHNWAYFIDRGDDASFSEIYNKVVDDLFAYGISLGFQRESCKDAIQDVFIKIYLSRKSLSHIHNITPYIFRSFKNRLIDIARKDKFEGSDRNANWGDEDYVNSQFALMKSQFIDKNIPVILGEYGVFKRTLLTEAEQTVHEASRLYYLEYVTNRARYYGLVPFYWDNGASSSRIFNRNDYTVTDKQTLNALMNGVTK